MSAIRTAFTRVVIARPVSRTPAVFAGARHLSTSQPRLFKARKDDWASKPEISYDEFKRLTQQPSDDVVIIDTREPDQAALNPIPGAVNVPLSRVADAFSDKFHPGNFQKDFAFPKPNSSQKMVFLDHSSKRSSAAAEAAQKNGYPNVRNYSGGVKEYQEKEKAGK